MANTEAADWDELSPVSATEAVGAGAAEIRNLRAGLADRIGKEHIIPSATGLGGEHKAGSAIIYIGDYSEAYPTTQPDGTALAATDLGRLAYNTDDGNFYILTNHVGPVWTLYPADPLVLDEIATEQSTASVTTVLDTQDFEAVAGKTYFISTTFSTSTLNSLPIIGLFIGATVLDCVHSGANDNHNHTGKAGALIGTYAAEETGTVTLSLKSRGAVALRSWKVVVIAL